MIEGFSKGKFHIEGMTIEPFEGDELFNSLEPMGIQESIKKIEKTQEIILSRLPEPNIAQQLETIFTKIIKEQYEQLSQVVSSLQVKMNDIANTLDRRRLQEVTGFQRREEESVRVERMSKINLDRSDSHYFGSDQSDIGENMREGSFTLNDDDDFNKSVMALDEEYQLHESFDKPNFLLKHLKDKFQEMSLTFTTCEKVYDFPEMRETNFHQMIDNRNNLFFLVQLENKEILGAFTHLGFYPQPLLIPKQNPKSFICNLNKNIFVYAHRISKTHSYDKNYLIFGNWQIKVKTGQNFLQTNWGTNGDCFLRSYYGKDSTTSVKLQWFFGSGADARLKIKQYHIYIFT